MHRLALVFALANIAFAQTHPIELRDYYKIESVSAPEMSPDGQRIAYVRTRIVEGGNKRFSEIWVAPFTLDAEQSQGGKRVSEPAVYATNPQWSSDGRVLSYNVGISGGGVLGNAPWFVKMDGAVDAKPYQVKGVEGTPLFSPDGKWIAFTKKVPRPKAATERSEFDKLTDERFKGRIYDWMNIRYDGRGYLGDSRNPDATPPVELFIIPTGGGEARQLTHGGVDVAAPAWRPDSQALAYAADLHQRDEYAYERADLWTVTLDGTTRMITKDDGWHHQSPAWSPDGRFIAALREEGLARVLAAKKNVGSPIDIYLFPVAGGEARNVTASWDDMPGPPHWSADGKWIYFQGGIKGTEHLFQIAITDGKASGKVQQVTQGDRVVLQASVAGDHMAYISSTTDRPGEVYVASLPADGGPPRNERKVSAVNDALVASWQLGKVERIQYDSKDGTSIDGWVVLPPGYDASKGGYPLILTIHGGPHGAYTSSFAFEEQLMAAAGYIVLYTNPRGSTGYGEQFRWGTWGGWGDRDFEDVMGGVDYALKHYRGDPARLGVTGYSYGGFLTNWIIGQTTRFAAAVVGAGPSDWVSNYGTGDIPRTKEMEFYGRPWEENARAAMLKHSPVLYAENIRTPTLFLHGEADLRVPIAQGEEMYTALKKQRVPAKFVRYPGEYHGGWSPWDMVHRYREEMLWWKRYLGTGR